MQLSTDASIRHTRVNGTVAGLAAILTHEGKEWVWVALARRLSSMEAEAAAMVMGLKLADHVGAGSLLVFTDNHSPVNSLARDQKPPTREWEKRVYDMLLARPDTKLEWCSREAMAMRRVDGLAAGAAEIGKRNAHQPWLPEDYFEGLGALSKRLEERSA